MNRIMRYIFVALLMTTVVACEIVGPDVERGAISLIADVDSHDSSPMVRGSVYTGTSAVGMTASVWFSTTSGQYIDNQTPVAPTFLPYRATVKYESNPTTVYVNPATMENPLSYPTSGDDVYCVGLYPQAGWSSSDGKSVTHTIDGTTDLMFAEQISGSWQTPFTNQTYKHLLTWLKFEVRVTTSEAIRQWGTLKKMSIINSHNTVDITFPQTPGNKSVIDFVGAEQELIVMSGEQDLTITAENVGWLLCSPCTEFKLKITTSEVENKEVMVSLYDMEGNKITDSQDAVGKLFIINLYFKSFNDIDATCSLIPWNEQNVDLVDNQ